MHRLLLDGVPHDVWLCRRDGEYVLMQGQSETVLRPNSDAIVVTDGDDVYIHLDGTAYTVRFQDALARYAEEAVGDRGNIARAPMPGYVIDIFAQPGDAVAAGAPLLVIESMKLQTTIKATRDGIVRQIHVKVGQKFDRDAILVTLTNSES
jgi:biotin carboxyl carrier protein